MNSIKKKLVSIIIPIVVVILVVITTLTFITSKSIIVDESKETLVKTSKISTLEINSVFTDALSTLDTMQSTLSYMMSAGATNEIVEAYLNKFKGDTRFLAAPYIANTNGDFIQTTDWIPPAGFDPRESQWYKEGLLNDKMKFGIPYKDSRTGELIVSATGNIKGDNGEIKGVMAVDMSLNVISKYVSEASLDESGEAILIDTVNNVIIADKNNELMGASINDEENVKYKELYNSSVKDSVIKMKIDGKNYFVNSNNVDGTEWILISTISEKSVLSELNALKRFVILISGVAILILIILVTRTINVITKPIKHLTGVIAQITEGDFTVEIQSKGNDEIALMSKSLEKFLEVMKGSIGEIRNTFNSLNGQAENSSVISDQLYSSATSQAASMEQLNVTVEELAKSITEVTERATSLAMVVSDTGESGKIVNKDMESTVIVSNKGKESMNQINGAIKVVGESIEELENVVEQVGESTVEISSIVNMISDIASQTNLLALNAAIEAARAGESGKGFAVVADEIRKLAETSSKAASDISNLTGNISKLVGNTISKTKESVETIERSGELVLSAGETFNSIYEAVSSSNAIVNEMVEKVLGLEDISASLAAITEEQSAGVEEILATSEQLSELADNVVENSKSVSDESIALAENSSVLKEQIEIFKI